MSKIGNYVANQVLTASPAELILLLFDEGIRTLKKTEAAFALEDPTRLETINNNLIHAQDVIQELSLSLDMEKGGEISTNLSRIYDFMLRHLSYANTEKLLPPVVEVRELLATLREAWLQVVEQEHETKTPSSSQRPHNHNILAAG